MTDCKTTYRKVKEIVKCLYPADQLTGNLARNMNTLTALIAGIIIGKETQLQISHRVRKHAIIIQSALRSKRFFSDQKR